jgi:hypothetical protein
LPCERQRGAHGEQEQEHQDLHLHGARLW